MKILVTGSLGLVGMAACKRYLKEGHEVVGIDCNARKEFFGENGSTAHKEAELQNIGTYKHFSIDIADKTAVMNVFSKGFDAVIHCAAQPAHDWATQNTRRDFEVNTLGTLNVLESIRTINIDAPVIHVSTSKVYGDNPNRLPLAIVGKRLDLPAHHEFYEGLPETFSIDNCLHSFFGVSKSAGDLYAQEYGKHLGLKVGIFRPGCITGSDHQGVPLHGFLSYLTKCLKNNIEYTVIGYEGYQVRCNIHADDLVNAFSCFIANPKPGEVYNMGGRELSCSIREAIADLEEFSGKKLKWTYTSNARTGDHRWYISNTIKFRNHYGWKPLKTLKDIYLELIEKA
jgi:CDP-paratose 2-epimerase